MFLYPSVLFLYPEVLDHDPKDSALGAKDLLLEAKGLSFVCSKEGGEITNFLVTFTGTGIKVITNPLLLRSGLQILTSRGYTRVFD